MKQFDAFRLDTVNECLWRENERILLTPKAFSLLKCLVQRAGALVTQAELMDLLWPDTFVQPEVLKTHIKDLRAVLGDDARNPRFIETQHRRGYRFIASVKDPGVEPARQGNGALRSQSRFPIPIGQESAVRDLRNSFAEARTGSIRLVFVTGEAGIGKTTLVNSFERNLTAEASEVRVLRGQCVEGLGGREPYYSLLEGALLLLRSPSSEMVHDQLMRYAPTWLAQYPAHIRESQLEPLMRQTSGATTERMTREFCEFIEALTADSPMLMILEDVHWADPYTVGCIESLVRGHWKAKVLVVATYRPVSLSVLQHPVKSLKRHLISQALCTEIGLSPLSPEEVTGFLKQLAPNSAPPPGLSEFLYRHSEGNPLFLRSAVQHFLSDETLALDDSQITIKKPLESVEPAVPETLQQLIDVQIDSDLKDNERTVLEAASVCGESFDSVMVAEAAGMPPDEVDEICGRLSQHGNFLRALGTATLPDGSLSSRFEFIHSLYREVFYGKLSPTRQTRIHKLVGKKLESLNAFENAALAPQLAYHYEKGSEWRRLPDQLLAVAELESKRFAFNDALGVLDKALLCLHHMPEHEAEPIRVRILLGIAANYAALDEYGASCDALEKALRSPFLADRNRERIHLLLRIAHIRSRMDARSGVLAANMALELSKDEEDVDFASEVKLQVNFWRVVCEEWNSSLVNECKSALAQLEQCGTAPAIGECRLMCAILKYLGSEYAEAASLLENISGTAIGDSWMFFRTTDRVAALVFMFGGDLGTAYTVAVSAMKGAARDGNHTREHLNGVSLGWIHFYSFDFAGALDLSSRSLPHLRAPHSRAVMNSCRILHAAADAALGNLESAKVQCAAIESSMENHPAWSNWMWRLVLLWIRTQILMQSGTSSEAQEAADRFLTASLSTAERTWQALAWESSARAALMRDDALNARQCIEHALAIVETGDLPLANWRVRRTAIRLFPENAAFHRASAAATLQRMADSLKKVPHLQAGFLSSPEVREILY